MQVVRTTRYQIPTTNFISKTERRMQVSDIVLQTLQLLNFKYLVKPHIQNLPTTKLLTQKYKYMSRSTFSTWAAQLNLDLAFPILPCVLWSPLPSTRVRIFEDFCWTPFRGSFCVACSDFCWGRNDTVNAFTRPTTTATTTIIRAGNRGVRVGDFSLKKLRFSAP